MQHANLQPLLANHVPVQANHGPPQTQTTEQRIDQLIIAIDNGVDTIDQHQEKSRLTGQNAACSAIFGKLGNLGGAVVQALPNFDTWGQVSEAEQAIISQSLFGENALGAWVDIANIDKAVTLTNYGACAVMLGDVVCAVADRYRSEGLPLQSDSVGNLIYLLCFTADKDTAKNYGEQGSKLVRIALAFSSGTQLASGIWKGATSALNFQTGSDVIQSSAGLWSSMNSYAGISGEHHTANQVDDLEAGLGSQKIQLEGMQQPLRAIKDDVRTLNDQLDKLNDQVNILTQDKQKQWDNFTLETNQLKLERNTSHERHIHEKQEQSDYFDLEMGQLKLERNTSHERHIHEQQEQAAHFILEMGTLKQCAQQQLEQQKQQLEQQFEQRLKIQEQKIRQLEQENQSARLTSGKPARRH